MRGEVLDSDCRDWGGLRMRICAGGRAAEAVEGGQDIQRSVEILPRNHRDKAQREAVSRGHSRFRTALRWAKSGSEVVRLSSFATGEDLGETRRVGWDGGGGRVWWGVGAEESGVEQR